MIDYDDIPDAEWSLSRIDIRNIIDKYPDKVVDDVLEAEPNTNAHRCRNNRQ